MKRILAKELKIKFVESLSKLDDFSYEDGNPFFMRIGSHEYFVFLKNLSPAYFKNLPDVTRVQLPKSEQFHRVLRGDTLFVILGYDTENDAMVCWNPHKVKSRLNDRENVSLYSRLSIQTGVQKGELKAAYLSNGEKFIVFKREYVINLFHNIEELFLESSGLENNPTVTAATDPKKSGNWPELIMDEELLGVIKPVLQNNRVLEAVEITMKFYREKYPDLKFKDWFYLVNNLYQQLYISSD